MDTGRKRPSKDRRQMEDAFSRNNRRNPEFCCDAGLGEHHGKRSARLQMETSGHAAPELLESTGMGRISHVIHERTGIKSIYCHIHETVIHCGWLFFVPAGKDNFTSSARLSYVRGISHITVHKRTKTGGEL